MRALISGPLYRPLIDVVVNRPRAAIDYALRKLVREGYVEAAKDVGDDDPLETLIESAIQTISTDVRIKVGEVEMHLAAWQDPDHWEEDWLETHGLSPEDVHALVEGAVSS